MKKTIFTKALMFIILISSLSFSIKPLNDYPKCTWGSPSLKNADIESWVVFSDGSINYSVHPTCPKCGKIESSGTSSGLSAPSGSQTEKRYQYACCWNKECMEGKNCYRYEYGFFVTSSCD